MKLSIKIITIMLLMSFLKYKSQTVIIWGQKNANLPENFNNSGLYYYKDVYNYLDNFVGTWEYINGNEKFQIILTKIVKYHYVNSKIKLNFYEDGIAIQYKKYSNSTLLFQSPIINEPSFRASNTAKLEGHITDYGRVTVDANYWPTPLLPSGVFKHGGEYFHPKCIIEKIPQSSPAKIKFNLYLGQSSGFGNEYNNPAYAGQPTFSIPNNVVMTKVP